MDEQPAKVPKTDTENDVKNTSAAEVSGNVTDTKATEESEKMEVEEDSVCTNGENNEQNKMEELPVCVDTVVEEITDSNEPEDAPVCDIEPIVIEEKTEENKEKTEEKETEKMDSESTDNLESVKLNENENLKNTDDTSAAKETPPIIVTEIEEIPNDKQSIEEVAEIIDDLEPVVEEPTAVEDMEELQNVGEVLEKECDEILSKVQDVTNLDNIPLKPLLNSIAEEAMETDNVDSNDIVDRILDTELELEMKQCEDIDLNTVAEVTDEAKTDIVEETNDKKEETIEQNLPEENNIIDNKTTEEKIEISSTAQTNKEEVKVEEAQKSETDNKDTPAEQSSSIDKNVPSESKEKENIEDESKVKETQVNGKATNGDNEAMNLNGDTSKNEELTSRLSEEKDEVVNGSNGDSSEQGQGDSKPESELADIKVKTVATEPRTDPIEQPTEA